MYCAAQNKDGEDVTNHILFSFLVQNLALFKNFNQHNAKDQSGKTLDYIGRDIDK